MLHLTNGDAAAQPMRQAGLPGDVIVWPDVLYEGPAPSEHGTPWRLARARYLSEGGHGAFEDILREYERTDAALDLFPEHDELVLWFEHDLFDQLLIARHLHWLGTRGAHATRLSLVCIDRFPGVEPFHGLGQLTPSQLASLFPSRQPITREQLRAGADVWRAFTSDDPRALTIVVQQGMPELPFMAGALKRYLEEFPGTRDGLSRTERCILQELRAGPRTPRDLFLAVQRQEERVFMGDTSFWQILRGMASGPVPLVGGGNGDRHDFAAPEMVTVPISLSPAGERVLDGEDAIALRGIDRWMGGVHLTPDQLFRWDGVAGELT